MEWKNRLKLLAKQGIPNLDIFSQTWVLGLDMVKPGYAFWIFTNENEEADDCIEEKLHIKCIYDGYTVVHHNSTPYRPQTVYSVK